MQVARESQCKVYQFDVSKLTTILIVASIVGSGLITGLLFAFSNFVMRALAQLPPDKGMFAMQRVNETIINPIFLALFFGTPLLCLVIAVTSAPLLDEPGRLWLFSGAVAYLAGPFGITMLFNVPLNNRLARANNTGVEVIWTKYQKSWQRWNHLRTYIGIVSLACLATGLGTVDA